MLAGSSLPVTWRLPDMDLPLGCEIEDALMIGEGGSDAMDFHALEGLQEISPLPVCVAVFSDATSFKTKRRDFFPRFCKQARHVFKVEAHADNQLSFTREKAAPLLSV